MPDVDRWYTTPSEAMERKMTIVAALRESQAFLLIAADKIAFDECTHIESSVEKLYPHARTSVVVGCAGNYQMAKSFGEWFQNLDISQDWTQLEAALRQYQAELHGRERKLVELAGGQWTASHELHFLAIGSPNGQLKMLEITETPQFHDDFYAIGSGTRQGYAARFAVNQISQNQDHPLSKVQALWLITAGAVYAPSPRPIDAMRVATGSLPKWVFQARASLPASQ